MPSRKAEQEHHRAALIAAGVVTLAIFAADLLTPLQGAVAVLYIIVVLLVTRTGRPRAVMGAGLVCAALALVAFAADHLGEPIDSATVRLGVSLVAITATTLLSVRELRAEAERNEARARLAQASAELAHAARISTLGQLAASLAHEVNQPLSAIINYGKSGKRWLGREEPNLAEVANCLDHIVSNGNRAADVIARVRAQARNAAPEPGPLDMADLVKEAVALLAREAQAARVAVLVFGGEALPPAMGDRVQVQQVLVNLLMNAIQAMREIKGRPRELCIRLAEEDGMVRVAVEDCGTGIEGEPARIFDPFFTTKKDGMGLGLSICRSIIEAQGGRITAGNNPAHGATIAFTLPVAAGAAPPIQT